MFVDLFTYVTSSLKTKQNVLGMAKSIAGSSTGSGIEMDPEVARNLFEEGAVFVLLDVPVGTEFGIDMNTWNTGQRFKGVKMIPPGIHFIYFR